MEKDAFLPLAAALRAARQRKRLSQRAVGERVGMPQSQVSRIENAAGDVRISTLLELARALDLDLILVPRRLVPLVERLVQDASLPDGDAGEERALYELTRDDEE